MNVVRRKKQTWHAGDVFFVPLKDGTWGVGQVIDLMMPNVIRCLFFDLRFQEVPDSIDRGDLTGHETSCVAVTREQIDYGVWKVGQNLSIKIPNSWLPNEQFRQKAWVGAVMYDAALAEDFLNSFFGLLPWDDWHDPNFLDEFLLSPEKKPKKLLLKNRKQD
jgi:hypothetical protein